MIMAQLKMPAVVVRDGAGNLLEADGAECACGARQFYVFQVRGENHFHLQCASCRHTYCPADAPHVGAADAGEARDD